MAITAPPNCAVRNRDENRAQNTWRTPESGVSLSQFYWRTRTIHQNAGVSRRKLARLLQEMSERFQRRLGNVMLNSLGVSLGNLGGDTQCNKQIHDDPVTGARSFSESLSSVRKKHSAIWQSLGQPLALQPGDRLDRGCVGHT